MTGPVATEALDAARALILQSLTIGAPGLSGCSRDAVVRSIMLKLEGKVLAPLLAALQQVTAERDARGEVIANLVDELARLRAEGEAKDRALNAFAGMLSDREELAHDALQVGGLVPLDPEFEVEVPLSLLYAARTALTRSATAKEG